MFKKADKKGFALVELLAVIVLLAIILAIAIPGIGKVIKTSTRSAFESDAKLFIKEIGYKKISENDFNPEIINKDNINELLGLSEENYETVSVTVENNVPEITIIGKGKWEGLIAFGTSKEMRIVDKTSDCNTDVVSPVITILGDNPVNIYEGEIYNDEGATALDDRDGDITGKIVATGTVTPSIPGVYTITYTVTDMAMNETKAERTINVIDIESPIITFNPKSNSTYAKSRSIIVDVTDKGGLNNNTLKYVWTTQTTEPLIEMSANSFTSGETI